jgi:hypothetical protein
MSEHALLVYLSGDFSEADVTAFGTAVRELGRSQRWTLEAPELIDQTDASSCTQPEDQPIRTLGARLPVTGPEEVPGTPVQEVRALIEGLASLSRSRSLEMEVQLDNTYVGEICSGVIDRLLREGLLERW